MYVLSLVNSNTFCVNPITEDERLTVECIQELSEGA